MPSNPTRQSRRRWLHTVASGASAAALGRTALPLAAWGLPAGFARASAELPELPELPKLPEALRGQGYRLVKDWDFGRTVTNEAQLKSEFFTRYIYDNGKLDKLKDEWQRYRDNRNHVFENGLLALVARAPAGVLAPDKIESGMLRSKWSGQFGYFECRMKVPGGRGMWPAFWLNPQDQIWPPEIDIVEIVNNGRDTTRNSFHFVHAGFKEGRTLKSLLDKHQTYRPGWDYQDNFHTFAVEWTPTHTRHYVDDVMVIEREFSWRHKGDTDAGPAHVLLNLAVGGTWPGPAINLDDFPAKLLVQHMRVWQR